MKTATITEAKNGLSALIDRVRGGETVLILDRGVPVARLEPAVDDRDPSGRIRRLQRAGAVRVGEGQPPVDVVRTPPPAPTGNARVVEALLEERRSGR